MKFFTLLLVHLLLFGQAGGQGGYILRYDPFGLPVDIKDKGGCSWMPADILFLGSPYVFQSGVVGKIVDRFNIDPKMTRIACLSAWVDTSLNEILITRQIGFDDYKTATKLKETIQKDLAGRYWNENFSPSQSHHIISKVTKIFQRNRRPGVPKLISIFMKGWPEELDDEILKAENVTIITSPIINMNSEKLTNCVWKGEGFLMASPRKKHCVVRHGHPRFDVDKEVEEMYISICNAMCQCGDV